MKETQYTRILKALRKAGNKGCTVRDLLQFTNYPSARIFEMTTGHGHVRQYYGGHTKFDGVGWCHTERIERHERQHNGRTIRVYVLKRVA